jgi:hypothetical protein
VTVRFDRLEPTPPRPPGGAGPADVFLASQESSHTTGERTGVTSGMPMP